MQRYTRSILQELEDLSSQRDQKLLVENRASNVIASAVNIIKMLESQYTPEEAEILERKLLLAIKAKDQTRFTNSLRKINENKRHPK